MKASQLREAQDLIDSRATAKEILSRIADGEDVVVSSEYSNSLTLAPTSDLAVQIAAVLRTSIIEDEAELTALGVTEYDTDDQRADDEDETEEAA